MFSRFHCILNPNLLLQCQQRLVEPPLRFPDEPCRHKVLDFIGDLSLFAQFGSQGLPVAHIVAYKACLFYPIPPPPLLVVDYWLIIKKVQLWSYALPFIMKIRICIILKLWGHGRNCSCPLGQLFEKVIWCRKSKILNKKTLWKRITHSAFCK